MKKGDFRPSGRLGHQNLEPMAIKFDTIDLSATRPHTPQSVAITFLHEAWGPRLPEFGLAPGFSPHFS